MIAKQPDSTWFVRAALSSLIALSLGACSVPASLAASSFSVASKRVAYATPGDTYDRDAIKELLTTLTYAGNDVQVSPDEVYIESRDGRVIIWHGYEIPYYEDVPEVMQRESRRCIALSVALKDATINNTEGGSSPFVSITWVLTDGHGNNYFAIVDGQGIAYTASRPLELFPQADGFILSDTIYVSISRRLSGIPPRSGEVPCDINGDPVVCTGWLSVPDELWTVGLPEKPEDSDASAYWSSEDIEIEAPAVWYYDFMDEEPAIEEEVIPEDDYSDEESWSEDGGEYVDPEDGEYVDPSEGGGEGGEGGEPVDPSEGGEGGEAVDPSGGGEPATDGSEIVGALAAEKAPAEDAAS